MKKELTDSRSRWCQRQGGGTAPSHCRKPGTDHHCNRDDHCDHDDHCNYDDHCADDDKTPDDSHDADENDRHCRSEGFELGAITAPGACTGGQIGSKAGSSENEINVTNS